MEWTEQRGKIVGKPALTPSLCTSAVFPGGRNQLFCIFPGVFWKKYGLSKGAECHWTLKGSHAQAVVVVPRRARREIAPADSAVELTQSVYLLRHKTRYRVNIPKECRQAAGLTTEHFARWEETADGIVCVFVAEDGMDTTAIEERKAGTQVEIPKFLCEKYDLYGKSCLWTLTQGALTGLIRLTP